MTEFVTATSHPRAPKMLYSPCFKCGAHFSIEEFVVGHDLIVDGKTISAGFHTGCALDLSDDLERSIHQWIAAEAERAVS